MRSKIALKLLAFFAAALLVFALVSGVLFRSLFTRSVVDAKRADMLKRATSWAELLSEGVSGPGQRGMGRGGPAGGFSAYVRTLTEAEPNVWVLDENLELLSGGRMMGRTLTYDTLPPGAGDLVHQVFEGKTPFSEGFSDLLGAPTLTVGVPLMEQDRVAGAVLLHDSVSGIDGAIADGQRMLLYSGGAALVLAIGLALWLALGFTRPINRMKATAQRMAEGDYAAKTGVRQSDEIGALAGSIDTLSERLQAAREAGERQEEQRREFLANVSHELRTPVTVLRGSLEALHDGVVMEPGKVLGYYEQMLGETKGLQRLVNDLMELARLQNTDFAIERAPLVLQDVLNDSLRSAEQLAQAKDIRIARQVIEAPVPMEGDYARLRQMLLIVLDNAVKFSPPGGIIHVHMGPGVIRIRDEGAGIPAEDLPHVFDRFHKSRSEENRQGSGLGLAIAKQIAQRHGMDIDLESGPGQGTTVRFSWQAVT